jgi:hypothetical protein
VIGRIVLVSTLLLGATFGRLGPVSPGPGGNGECPALGSVGLASASSGAARGTGLAAVDGGRTLFTVSASGDRMKIRDGGSNGLLRHAASRPGIGTAYVNDLAGPDVLVAMRPKGVTRIEGSGELSHPAWSPAGMLAWSVDMAMLEVWSPDTGRRGLVPPPRGGSAVFSPVFTGARQLVAVVQEPAAGTHDDGLNNLWRFDLADKRWTRLTRFTAEGDRWAVVRTPVVAPDGFVLFVRVHGRASATKLPSFELWALRHGVASKVRDLPREMFVAGFLDGRLVWNVFDASTGTWRLVPDGPGGPEDLGCGAVSVDPRTELDPDLLGGLDAVHAHATGGEASDVDPGSSGAGLAVLLGDFSSEGEAEDMAAQLSVLGAVVVDHAAAPTAVRPGAWAVIWPLPAAAHPDEALDGLRALHPELADRMWVVALGDGDGLAA